jgi:hypothetical protein
VGVSVLPHSMLYIYICRSNIYIHVLTHIYTYTYCMHTQVIFINALDLNLIIFIYLYNNRFVPD